LLLLFHCLPLSSPPPHILLQPVTTLYFPPTHSQPTIGVCSNCTHSPPLQLLTQAPSASFGKTPTHTQGPPNPAASTPFPLHTPPLLSALLLAPPLPITPVSVSSQTTMSPQLPLFIVIMIKGFSI
jgi:hypothetical protein